MGKGRSIAQRGFPNLQGNSVPVAKQLELQPEPNPLGMWISRSGAGSTLTPLAKGHQAPVIADQLATHRKRGNEQGSSNMKTLIANHAQPQIDLYDLGDKRRAMVQRLRIPNGFRIDFFGSGTAGYLTYVPTGTNDTAKCVAVVGDYTTEAEIGILTVAFANGWNARGDAFTDHTILVAPLWKTNV
jgi:hypothetical protein